MEKENNLEEYLDMLDFKERDELTEMIAYKVMSLEDYTGKVPKITMIQVFKKSYEIGKKLKPEYYEEFIDFVCHEMDEVDEEGNHDYDGTFEKKVIESVENYKPGILEN